MNKVALITGASSGIGLELANVFAENNIDLVLVARNEERLNNEAERLQKKFGTRVTVIPKDLSDRLAPLELLNELNAKNIEIDFLVNNAGFGDYGKFHESDWQKQKEMLDLNVASLTHLCHLFIPEMLRKGRGHIMNVASTAAFFPGPLMSVYYATKVYVLHFTEALAEELKGTGIRVTALCPGATATGFQESASIEQSKKKTDQLPTAKEVARYGFKAMMKGKVIAIPGKKNLLLTNIPRVLPRKWAREMVKWMQEKRKKK